MNGAILMDKLPNGAKHQSMTMGVSATDLSAHQIFNDHDNKLIKTIFDNSITHRGRNSWHLVWWTCTASPTTISYSATFSSRLILLLLPPKRDYPFSPLSSFLHPPAFCGVCMANLHALQLVGGLQALVQPAEPPPRDPGNSLEWSQSHHNLATQHC